MELSVGVAENLDRLVGVLVVGGDDATIAETTEILRWKVTEGANHATRTNADTTMIFRADCLRRVLDHRNAMLVGDVEHRIEVRSLPEQMDRHDCLDVFVAAERRSSRLRADVGAAGQVPDKSATRQVVGGGGAVGSANNSQCKKLCEVLAGILQ